MGFKLHIQNFQSIEDAVIEFDGFTVVVGPTNLGKSAVVRAFYAWAFNELHPNFIRRGAKDCTLTGEWETPVNGVKRIEFKKQVTPSGTATVNKYTVYMADGTVKDYPKIGTDTPDELKEMRFEPLVNEREERFYLNVQKQLEPLFLISPSTTPTTLTSFLNQIFDIAAYERALADINSDIIKIDRDYNALEICKNRAIGESRQIVLNTVRDIIKL